MVYSLLMHKPRNLFWFWMDSDKTRRDGVFPGRVSVVAARHSNCAPINRVRLDETKRSGIHETKSPVATRDGANRFEDRPRAGG